jgi:hypothetical protein|tara:strand:- start:57 stop:995 length:939 start_codon:yes stop_codon:yes gene_type:complete
MIDIERWYTGCLKQLGCELSGDRAGQIKDGLHLFVDEPDWLQYVLQESGWLEQKAMVAALSKMGSVDISLTINNPKWVTENLFLATIGCANTNAISFVYGERLSEESCQFLQFLGWNDCAEALDVEFGSTGFESTLLSIRRGDWIGVRTITDLLLDPASSKDKVGILTDSHDSAVNSVDHEDADKSVFDGEDGGQSTEQLINLIEPHLLRKPMNRSFLALKGYICKQIIDDPKAKNPVLYNKVADAIEEANIAVKDDMELKVEAQKKDIRHCPKVIFTYVMRGNDNWSQVTEIGFYNEVRACKQLLKGLNLY